MSCPTQLDPQALRACLDAAANIQVFALYAALNGLIALGLAVLAVRARRRAKVGLGDGGDAALLQAQRAHGNAAEYVPLVLVLLLALTLVQAPAALLHGIGGGLAFGRVLHAIGLYQSSGASVGRMLGILLTWAALLVAAAALLGYALAG